MFLSGVANARVSRQWTDASRYVKKGAKAIYMLVPRLIKRETTSETGEAKKGNFGGIHGKARIFPCLSEMNTSELVLSCAPLKGG
jgi:hypothetical protein